MPPFCGTLHFPTGRRLGQFIDTGAGNWRHAAAGVYRFNNYTAEFYKQTGQVGDVPLSFAQISNTVSAKGLPVELRSGLKLAGSVLYTFQRPTGDRPRRPHITGSRADA